MVGLGGWDRVNISPNPNVVDDDGLILPVTAYFLSPATLCIHAQIRQP